MANDPARKSAKTNNDWLVGHQVDRYHVLHRLAAGGMGAVYVARAVGMGGFERLVAIKVLHPHLADEEEFISMLLDEARLAARIRHPNVVATLDVAQWEDLHYLVMDYVEGDHLAGLLSKPYKTGGRLPLRPALRIVFEALAGLTAAHELKDGSGNPLNLVHRDVSPQNILVGVDGISRLTDFGVAKAEYRLSSTRQGTFKGKLAYTAPETASQAHAEQRSDLFAMGVVLWEVLTTQRLFKAETNIATLKKLLEDPIPPPSSVYPELAPFDPVIAKALARPLEERFQTGAEMMEAIERAAVSTGGMGTTREVSTLVRELAATKLTKEQEAIQAAIDRLDGDAPKAYSTGRHQALEDLVPSQPPTVSGKIEDLPEPVTPAKKRPIGLVVAVILALGAAGGLAAALWPKAETPGDVVADEPGADEEPPAEGETEGAAGTAAETAEGETETEQSEAAENSPGETDATAMAEPSMTEMATTAPAQEQEEELTAPSMRRNTRGMRRGRMTDDEDGILSNPYR